MPRTKGAKDLVERATRNGGSTHFFATFQKFVRDELYNYLDKYPNIAAFLICNETGWGDHEHSHAYIQTAKPTLLKTLRKFLTAEDFALGDLQSCKSAKSTITYCSKEDFDVKLKNIDREQLHINWKIHFAASQKNVLSELSYNVRSIAPNYHLKLQTMHREIWHEHYCDLDKKNALSGKKIDSQTLCDILNSDKKGIWIYGETGTGKSTAVMICLNSPFCRFLGESLHFPLNNYAGEEDILFEECGEDGYRRHRELLLQITSGFSAVGDRKNNTHFVMHLEGKLYITSNFAPPSEPEFLRRFAVFHFMK